MWTLALLLACNKSPDATHPDKPEASATSGARPSDQADVSGLTPITTPTGLTYYVLKPGTGAVAADSDTVHMHYSGWLTNGKPVDSSAGRNPISFVLGRRKVIAGWDQGILGMAVGEKRQLRIPYALGYGEGGRSPKVPPSSDLIFDIELVSIDGK